MSVHDADIILYSMRVPSLKFPDLPIPKIRLIFGHGVNRPVDLDL